jgi:cell division protein FtsL
MATLATYFKRPGEMPSAEPVDRRLGPRVEPDRYRLRALPNDDVFFYCKPIDNSRVVREADPKARGECWSTIGAACVLAVLLTSVLAPNVASTLAGYKLQALKEEQHRLLNEWRVLELEEARLLSPSHLEELARDHQMITPTSGQVVHLDPKGDESLAMNVKK